MRLDVKRCHSLHPWKRKASCLSDLNITGAWFGRYAYPMNEAEAVQFIAALTETEGSISGTISEPNKHGILSDYVRAVVSGTRTGMQVVFVKTYDGAADYSHAVTYDGTLSADACEISGLWNIDGKFSGSFVMTREQPGVEEDVEAEELLRV